jgi:hypothetical protein
MQPISELHEPPLTKTDDNCVPTTRNISICYHRGTRTSPYKCSGTVPNRLAACSLGVAFGTMEWGLENITREKNSTGSFCYPDLSVCCCSYHYHYHHHRAQQVPLGRNFSYYILKGGGSNLDRNMATLTGFRCLPQCLHAIVGRAARFGHKRFLLQFVSNSSVETRSTNCIESFVINLLKAISNLLYMKNKSVPRCKHFPPRL